MFQDFFSCLDCFIERETENIQDFDTIISGDFNGVLDPAKGSLNRATTAIESNLSCFISENMFFLNMGLSRPLFGFIHY